MTTTNLSPAAIATASNDATRRRRPITYYPVPKLYDGDEFTDPPITHAHADELYQASEHEAEALSIRVHALATFAGPAFSAPLIELDPKMRAAVADLANYARYLVTKCNGRERQIDGLDDEVAGLRRGIEVLEAECRRLRGALGNAGLEFQQRHHRSGKPGVTPWAEWCREVQSSDAPAPSAR